MLKFLFGLIFLIIAGLMGWIGYSQENFCIVCGSNSDASSTNINNLQMLLVNDLNKASIDKELPPIWSQILEVRYLYHSSRVKQTLVDSPIVMINKKGDKRLLVEFYDEPGDATFILVQYNLIDIPSGNTVGEVNRRLKLPENLRVEINTKQTKPVPDFAKPNAKKN